MYRNTKQNMAVDILQKYIRRPLHSIFKVWKNWMRIAPTPCGVRQGQGWLCIYLCVCINLYGSGHDCGQWVCLSMLCVWVAGGGVCYFPRISMKSYPRLSSRTTCFCSEALGKTLYLLLSNFWVVFKWSILFLDICVLYPKLPPVFCNIPHAFPVFPSLFS